MKERIEKLKERRKFFTMWLSGFLDNPEDFSTQIQLCEIQLIAIEKQLNLLEK